MDDEASAGRPGGGVFVCYRREDSSYPAGWLYQLLRDGLGSQAIFKDIDNLRPGDDYVEEIDTAVGSCAVLVAVIGREWLDARDGEGRRRLDDPNDLVRLEIETALARGVRVVPVLVSGARMPSAEVLPAGLVPLTRRHALELDPAHFEAGARELIAVVQGALAEETLVGGMPEPDPPERVTPEDVAPDPVVPEPVVPEPVVQQAVSSDPASRRSWWVAPGAIGLAVVVVAVTVWQAWPRSESEDTVSRESAVEIVTYRLTVERPRTLPVGCELTLIDQKTGASRDFKGADTTAAKRTYQVPNRDWIWSVNDPRCVVTREFGTGELTLPYDHPLAVGDTAAFEVSGVVRVKITGTGGQGECRLELRSVATGEVLDSETLTAKTGALAGQAAELDPNGTSPVYVATPYCAIRITEA